MSRESLNNVKLVSIVAVFLIALVVAPVTTAEENSSPQIAFLQLEFDSNGVSLLKATIVDGTLKTPRAKLLSLGYYYEAVSADSTVRYQGTFENPLVQRFEFHDPDNPGEIKIKVVELAKAVVVVRLPFGQNMHSLDIYQISSTDAKGLGLPKYNLISRISLED